MTQILLYLSLPLCALTIISCSPVVGEYVYRGTLRNTTIGGTQKQELRFKEYKDGTISGECQLLASTYRDIKTTKDASSSVRGSIHGNQIEFRYTPHQITQSNAGAKIAAFFDTLDDGYTIQRGTFSKNRKSINGYWQGKISNEVYRGGAPQNQQGTFAFQLISGTDFKSNKKISGSTKNHRPKIAKPETKNASGTQESPIKISVENPTPAPTPATSPQAVKISVE